MTPLTQDLSCLQYVHSNMHKSLFVAIIDLSIDAHIWLSSILDICRINFISQKKQTLLLNNEKCSVTYIVSSSKKKVSHYLTKEFASSRISPLFWKRLFTISIYFIPLQYKAKILNIYHRQLSSGLIRYMTETHDIQIILHSQQAVYIS